MAVFRTDGLQDLGLSMAQLAVLPDDTIYEMLEAEATVVVEAHRDEIQKKGLVDSGQLLQSIGFKRGKDKDGRPQVDVYPLGKRRDGVRNAEVGFILEYGAPNRGEAAKQWMRTANEKCADEAVATAFEVYDKYIDSIF